MATERVNELMSQRDIATRAKAIKANWVVIFHDHYRGNAEGYYQAIEDFENSKHFHWHESYADRGAVSVVLTDEDVPSLVAKKRELAARLRELIHNKVNAINQAWHNIGPLKHIDGRWGKNNPKRIEAMEFNKKLPILRKQAEENVTAIFREEEEALRAEIVKLALVSSSMWQFKN